MSWKRPGCVDYSKWDDLILSEDDDDDDDDDDDRDTEMIQAETVPGSATIVATHSPETSRSSSMLLPVAQPVHAASGTVIQGELVTDEIQSEIETHIDPNMAQVVQGELIWEDDYDTDDDDDDDDAVLPLCSATDDNAKDRICYHGISKEIFEGDFQKAFQEYFRDCYEIGINKSETDPAVIAQKAAFHQKYPDLFSGNTAEAFCNFLLAWSLYLLLLSLETTHRNDEIQGDTSAAKKTSTPVVEEAMVAMCLAIRWRYRVIHLQEHYNSEQRNRGLKLMKYYTALGKHGGTRGMLVVLEKHLPCTCVRTIKRTLQPTDDNFRIGVCLGCYKYVEGANLKHCSKCKEASYCSRACQTKHWKVHKKTCRPFLPIETS